MKRIATKGIDFLSCSDACSWSMLSVADLGFSRGWGAKPPGGPNIWFCQFSQKLHEIKRIWTPGRGGCPKFYYVDPSLVVEFQWNGKQWTFCTLLFGKLLDIFSTFLMTSWRWSIWTFLCAGFPSNNDAGVCGDPGEVYGAVRTGSSSRYQVNAVITYTCTDDCQVGGGNITCQSNGQWTEKPGCHILRKKTFIFILFWFESC